jgi:hypothetical protein
MHISAIRAALDGLRPTHFVCSAICFSALFILGSFSLVAEPHRDARRRSLPLSAQMIKLNFSSAINVNGQIRSLQLKLHNLRSFLRLQYG